MVENFGTLPLIKSKLNGMKSREENLSGKYAWRREFMSE